MENAADALKIGFAVAVFMIALTMLFGTATLVKDVTDKLILDSDKTTYYEYYESDMSSVDSNGNRIVTLEDIIPTMYRYFTESSAVTIVDKNGEIITRLDRQTETLCTNWNNRTQKQKETIQKEIDYVLKYCEGAKLVENVDNLEQLFRRIYGQANNSYYTKTFDCPWNGLESYTAQRIDSDLSGIRTYFSIRQPGLQGNFNAENKNDLANHTPCLGEGKGIIDRFKNSKFIEYLILYDTNNYITDEEDGDKLYAPRRT